MVPLPPPSLSLSLPKRKDSHSPVATRKEQLLMREVRTELDHRALTALIDFRPLHPMTLVLAMRLHCPHTYSPHLCSTYTDLSLVSLAIGHLHILFLLSRMFFPPLLSLLFPTQPLEPSSNVNFSGKPSRTASHSKLSQHNAPLFPGHSTIVATLNSFSTF